MSPEQVRDKLAHVADRLEAAGHLPPGSSKRYGPMFGFRNRIVHLYDRVEARRVHEIVRHECGDLADLAALGNFAHG